MYFFIYDLIICIFFFPVKSSTFCIGQYDLSDILDLNCGENYTTLILCGNFISLLLLPTMIVDVWCYVFDEWHYSMPH